MLQSAQHQTVVAGESAVEAVKREHTEALSTLKLTHAAALAAALKEPNDATAKLIAQELSNSSQKG
jgi:hypothetical protein